VSPETGPQFYSQRLFAAGDSMWGLPAPEVLKVNDNVPCPAAVTALQTRSGENAVGNHMFRFNLPETSPPGIFLILALSMCTFSVAGEEPVELEPMIVTAGLEPISAQDVASSITIITREEIEQRQAKYLADLLRDVPGFSVSQAGGPGTQTQVRVRGAEANQLLVLMDGIRANDPASADEFQFQYASTANIERIEIIRGPQSAIWGTDALAGVINIIRRRDVTDQYLAAEAEYGSFNSLSIGADGGISRDRYQLSGGISYMQTDGTNISREGDEDDGAENTNANIALEIDPSDSWHLSFSGQHVDSKTDFDDVDFFVSGLPADADRVTEAKRDYLRGEARFDPQASPWSGSFSLNWLDTDNENFSDGLWSTTTSAESLEFRLKASVLLGAGELQNHRLTFALDQENVDFSQRGIASPFGDPNQDQSYDVTGYAAEYVGSPIQGFSWTLNARMDDYSDFDDAFSWQFALSQRINSNWKVRGSAGTGSKAPTFTERYGFYPDFFIGNPDLKPETSTGWELGLETGFAEDRYHLSAVYFDQELEDEIDGFVFDLDTYLFTAANKEGISDRKGVELVLDGRVIDSLSFNATYTYVDATETDASGNKSREVRRPKHMASLNLRYWFADDRGNVNLNVNYNSEQLDNYFPPPYFVLEQIELDSYTVVDLAASWKLSGSLELIGRISNLFDEEYEEILGFARPGRAIYAGLRGRFAR
jgi:vitamin B12 transporter